MAMLLIARPSKCNLAPAAASGRRVAAALTEASAKDAPIRRSKGGVLGGTSVSLQRCTAALRALSGLGSWSRALAMLADMQLRGPRPDLVLFNAVLAACARSATFGAGDEAADAALHVLRQELPSANLRPDTVSFNATITACGRGQRWEVALDLLREMRDCHGLALTVTTYGAAVSACEKGSAWPAAMDLLLDATHRDVALNLLVYSAALASCGRGSRWDLSLEVLTTARRSWPGLDVVTVGCAIMACRRGQAWHAAVELAAELGSRQSITPVQQTADQNDFVGAECEISESRQRILDRKNCLDVFTRGRAAGHVPVLCEPIVEALLEVGGLDGVYVDCTFGRGGHTRALLDRLSPRGLVYTFDVDPSAISEAQRLAVRDSRVVPIHRPFGELAEALPVDKDVHGILADLGVSSPQLDQKQRGFSVLEDGPLDLRMNPRVGVSAADWLASASAEEISWVIQQYGEDDDDFLAARLGEAIAARVRNGPPVRRTRQLAELVAEVKAGADGFGGGTPFQQPARLVFQALRTHLNCEFQQLDLLLDAAMCRLGPGGRLGIVCFKHPEIAAVRRFLRKHEECTLEQWRTWPPENLVQLFPVLGRPFPDSRRIDMAGSLCDGGPAVDPTSQEWCVAEIGPPLEPSAEETRSNTRARSAVGLVLEKRPRIFRQLNVSQADMPPLFSRPSLGSKTESYQPKLNSTKL